ncbi:8940_t:CDS:2, partial [Acaulospora morrowiae]
ESKDDYEPQLDGSIVYSSVINDVIENVKKDFEDFGDDGTILAKLKRVRVGTLFTWEHKIKSAKVATWDQNDVAVGEERGQSSSGGLSVSTPFSQPPQSETMPKGPSGQEYDTPAANLAILATNTIMSDNNGVGRPQHFLPQAKNGNGISLPSTTATDNIAKYVYGNSQTEALQMSQNNAFVGQPTSYMQTMGNKQILSRINSYAIFYAVYPKIKEIDMHEQKLKENGSRAIGEAIQNAPTPPPQQPSFDSSNRESRLTDSFPEEDESMKELYTETSQYRNWNFTKDKLRETREINHKLAVERVKKKILEESILQKQLSENSSPSHREQTERANSPKSEVECLTLEDELALCKYYETQIRAMIAQFSNDIRENKFTDKVWATAVIFVKRFYLRNT